MATKQVSAKFNSSTATLTLQQCIDLIATVGEDVTVLVQGDMGSGKTSLLKEVSKRTGMRGVYFDCTTKDLGDLFLPDIYREGGVGKAVSFVPNEEFGVHHGEPIVLMLDELGKNRSILNGLLRVMQEHSVGSYPLPSKNGRKSIVFATTNLGAENVGDMLPPHARNRIMIVRMLKPTYQEWMDWAAQNGIEPCVIAAVHEFPAFLQSFTDVEKPEDNPYIYDPRDATRTSFVTPRSLERASRVLSRRDMLGNDVVTNALVGLLGGKAALDLMTIVNLGDTLPKYDAIVASPETVKVPDGVGARIISALTCMQRVEQKNFTSVFTYVQRLPMETQALFCNQLIKNSSKAVWVVQNASFTKFVTDNHQLFTN